ncbi:hypothetical protein MTO96_015134 [Rhipicephalus appendiculatus]
MAKVRRGLPSTAASRWAEPREELSELAHELQQKTPPDQYLGIDTATLYSLSLQSEDRGDPRVSWAPFVYAYLLFVLLVGFLLIYFLIRVGGRAPQNGARVMTEEANMTESPANLRTSLTSQAPCSSASTGSPRRNSGHTTSSFTHQGGAADNVTDDLTDHSAAQLDHSKSP